MSQILDLLSIKIYVFLNIKYNMNSKTRREVMGIIAIIVGIIFIIDPKIVAYLLGVILIIYGIMELVSRGRE